MSARLGRQCGALRSDGRGNRGRADLVRLAGRQPELGVPDWAKGTALAGVIAVSLAAVSSFASAWIQDPVSQRAIDFGSRMFWPEFAFLCAALGIIVFTVQKKRMRLLVILGSVLLLAFWLGITLS